MRVESSPACPSVCLVLHAYYCTHITIEIGTQCPLPPPAREPLAPLVCRTPSPRAPECAQADAHGAFRHCGGAFKCDVSPASAIGYLEHNMPRPPTHPRACDSPSPPPRDSQFRFGPFKSPPLVCLGILFIPLPLPSSRDSNLPLTPPSQNNSRKRVREVSASGGGGGGSSISTHGMAVSAALTGPTPQPPANPQRR